MEVIDGYSARDLEVLQIYIQRIRDEWAKGKRGKRAHGLNWHKEARRVLLLGIRVPTIEDVSASGLRHLRKAHVAANGGSEWACRSKATPDIAELMRLGLNEPLRDCPTEP